MSDPRTQLRPDCVIHFPCKYLEVVTFEPLPLIPLCRGFLVNQKFCPLPAGLNDYQMVEVLRVEERKIRIYDGCYEHEVEPFNLDVGWLCYLPGLPPLRETDRRVQEWLSGRLEDNKWPLSPQGLNFIKMLKKRCDVALGHIKWMRFVDV